MSNIYEQRFFSALKDTFIGHPIKGKSGYVNLMNIKAQYFAEIEPYIKAEIDKQIEAKFREELFEKLYNFFDCYLNETGTVFFANSQIHKNLYEKVYSDRDDVALFWKTQKLYYVKSEANYEDLQTEVNGIKILFDASEIKHAKGNEKKAIQFFLVKATKEEIIFKIRYQEQTKYDRLREYVGINNKNDLSELLEKFGTDIHSQILFEPTEMDTTVFTRKTEQKECIYIDNLDDTFNSVKVEYSISDFNLTLAYLHKKGIILYEEDLKKIFSIYKRQNEIDYFIHKDAEGFLKEQFDIYVYNWLFNDLDTDFDAATVKRMQNIKKMAHKVIEYIARFEDELKAIWEKPKFVRNCNYVLTLDKLANNVALIEKIIKSPRWKNQVQEWQELNKEWVDNNGNQTKKEWKEFEFIIEPGFDKNIIKEGKLNPKYQHLPIDTKFFPGLKHQILSHFNNLDNSINGVLIKSDNWQGLNSCKNLYNGKIDIAYIDPPFNTGADFDYKDKYQDSTWLTLMENRLELIEKYLRKDGSFFLHLDYKANFLGRLLLDKFFSKILNEIVWCYFKPGSPNMKQYNRTHQTIFWAANNDWKFYEDNVKIPYHESTAGKWETEGTGFGGEKPDFSNGKIPEDWWSDIPIVQRNRTEIMKFDTQKPEKLLKRIISTVVNKEGIVFDFFSGSGTTAATAHKLGLKWLTMEMGNHYYDKIIPRLKRILCGDQSGISRNEDVKWQGGGFFKYYELEQYEDVLSRAKYQWRDKKGKNQVEQYSFLQDQKLLDAIEIDYKNKNAKVVFENLYPDVDIAETLSNVSGKHIKQVFEDKVIFEDGSEVVYAEMTFEKYPWIKPLIWWNSK